MKAKKKRTLKAIALPSNSRKLGQIRPPQSGCESWPGEVVATFAGDEETMGVLGTQFLLDTVPEARGELSGMPL